MARAPLKLRTQAFALALAALTTMGLAQAQSQPPATPQTRRPWTADALVSRALENNPELRAYRWGRNLADAELQTASAVPNPSVRLEWLHAQQLASTGMGWGVGLQWTPPQPTEWSARKAQARAHRSEVDEELVERASELSAAIRLGCATADELSEQLQVAEQAIQVRSAIADIVKERVARGASTRLDLGMASLSVARAQQDRENLRIQRTLVLRDIALLAAVPPEPPMELAPEAQRIGLEQDALPTDADIQSLALQRRAVLRADAARAEQTEQALRAEKSKRWPWISLSSMPRYRVNDTSSNPHDLSFGLDVSVPIFDTNSGRIAAAQAERGRQSELRAAHEAEIRKEVSAARAEVLQRQQVLRQYQATIEPVLRDHKTLVQSALQARQFDLVALLAAEDMVLRSQRDFSEARLAYRKAKIQLARALGAAPTTLPPGQAR